MALDRASYGPATDFDVFQITPGTGTYTLPLQDAVPVLVADKTVTATVEEDDLNNAQGKGNNEDGSVGANVATGGPGALSVLVSVGADEPAVFGLTTIVAPVYSGLNSKGSEVLVVSDGSVEPVLDEPARDYVPSTRPGGRLPHGWIDASVSTQPGQTRTPRTPWGLTSLDRPLL